MMSPHAKKHILVITISGYGHIIPAVALAKRLAADHKITFAVPAFTLEHTRRKGEFPPGFQDQVSVVGYDDGIPPGMPEHESMRQSWFTLAAEGTPRRKQFFLEMPATAPPVVVENRKEVNFQVGTISLPVDLVIGDVFLAEPMVVLAQRNIPYLIFNCSTLGSFASFLYVTDNTPTAEVDSLEGFILIRPESEGPQPAIGAHMKEVCLSVNKHLETVRGFLVNSFREFDEKMILEVIAEPRMKNKDYYFVGPLMPEEKTSTTDEQHILEGGVKRWLDGKSERSVVYISFGSVSMPNEDRVRELGSALLKLGKPFIFALREQQHSLLPKELQEFSKKGDPNSLGLLLPWAPQKVILGHPAVGVFVSHCGWNSTIESIFNGKPIVGWPCFGDQLENALWIQEAGMGRSLIQKEAADDSGKKRVEATADALAEAILEASSEKCKEAAEEWQKKTVAAVAPGGCAHTELQRFVNEA